MNKRNNFFRVVSGVFQAFPVKMPLLVFMLLFCAAVNTMPSVFIHKIIALIELSDASTTWPEIRSQVISILAVLGGLYVLSFAGAVLVGQVGAEITQGVLMRLRRKMFDHMQDLPLKYFDTNQHGDIMSRYTNDVDSLRQMVSNALPQMITSVVTIVSVLSIMLWFSAWLTLITFAGIFVMTKVTRKIGGRSARNFRKQQKNTGVLEGFVEEMINGRSVIKVFCRERECIESFDRLNNDLFNESKEANRRANSLGPVLNNIGNILYVVTAIAGGLLIISRIPNVSISGLPMSISVVVPFLNMNKQFAMNINHLSMHLNAIARGLAGAGRIFALIDEAPEEDSGTLQADTSQKASIEFKNVCFGYVEGVEVLHNISFTAKPGQKTALVGSTGAGKTTIANLIPRFYDVNSGAILCNGQDIRAFTKSSLRRTLGIVLQDTHLFTGTVLENIRYGNLNASDDDCKAAAKLAGADEFIARLPEGWNTMLLDGGANLSQGQRQLLAIARAAAANPEVMILDEATSSIDTRTEALVQRGMDALMKGRTVFVIAHRLSTVRNSDLILVMEHGEIIERGNHDELMTLKGRYYDLYTGAFELN